MSKHRSVVVQPSTAQTDEPRRIDRRVLLVIVVVVVLLVVAGLVKLLGGSGSQSDSGAPAPSSGATTSPAAETSAAPPSPTPDEIRDSFFLLNANPLYSNAYGNEERGIALARGVCAGITANPSSGGVWDQATVLEDDVITPFSVEDAWGFVSLSASVYCSQYSQLVSETIEEATS